MSKFEIKIVGYEGGYVAGVDAGNRWWTGAHQSLSELMRLAQEKAVEFTLAPATDPYAAAVLQARQVREYEARIKLHEAEIKRYAAQMQDQAEKWTEEAIKKLYR